MEFSLQQINGITVLSPKGRIDTLSAREFEEKVISTIDGGAIKLIIPFDEIDYVSSAGLRVLLLAGKKLKALNGELILCGIADRILEVFKMSGFDKILKICDTLDGAVLSIN